MSHPVHTAVAARTSRRTIAHLTAAAGLLLGGCASVPPVGAPGNGFRAGAAAADPGAINWPEAYRPDDAVFFVHNEIEIAAPPEVIWSVLVDAESWPAWYRGATNVRVDDGDGGRLTAEASLNWRTMDLDFVSRIVEFEPPSRLAWESRRGLIKGYHAWLIVPSDGGSRVVTDESQHGFLAHMQRMFQPNRLRRLHDEWLEVLKVRAEAVHSGTARGEGAE